MSDYDELERKAREAKQASRVLARLSTEAKNNALNRVAERLLAQAPTILAANREDYAEAKAGGMDEAMLDRLRLNQERLRSMVEDVRTIAKLADPVGEVFEMRTLPNGLQVGH